MKQPTIDIDYELYEEQYEYLNDLGYSAKIICSLIGFRRKDLLKSMLDNNTKYALRIFRYYYLISKDLLPEKFSSDAMVRYNYYLTFGFDKDALNDDDEDIRHYAQHFMRAEQALTVFEPKSMEKE